MATFSYPCVIAWCALALPSAATQPVSDWQPNVRALIRQLGDPSFAKREAAVKALLAEGDKIVPLLDQARKDADLELGRRIDRVRYQLVGFIEELTEYLSGPAFSDAEPRLRTPAALLLLPETPDPLPGIVAFVAGHQPKSGDFLLKIIAEPNHQLHRPATQLFCESWVSASPQQLRTYLETTFGLQAVHRPRYPPGLDDHIGPRFWHQYGSVGWPKDLHGQITITHKLDGKLHGKPLVFTYPGGGAATGSLNAGKLEQGNHSVGCKVECVFTHQGREHRCKTRSEEVAFAVGPAVLANELVAPTDVALAKQVRAALRMLDYEGQDGRDKVARPWHPQTTWLEPQGSRGLHAPVWLVKEPLPVDLCFDVTMRDLHTGQSYPAESLVLHKGKLGRGDFTLRDPRAFCADRDGFIQVQIELRPSPTQALSDPMVTKYFPWPITSPTLRAKIVGEMKRMQSK